ncbi:hypothetical protein QE152_g15880 [Popillia japonica]|uniref:Uncharacterized protein n=1 Tax=Popillia japonica TaxID=7064 RepID=A0AAW1L4C9_POPJA
MSVSNYRLLIWITLCSCAYLSTASEDPTLFCGPLPPKDIAVTDYCVTHDSKSKCPTKGSIGSTVSRYCSPFYLSNNMTYITYTCDETGKCEQIL